MIHTSLLELYFVALTPGIPLKLTSRKVLSLSKKEIHLLYYYCYLGVEECCQTEKEKKIVLESTFAICQESCNKWKYDDVNCLTEMSVSSPHGSSDTIYTYMLYIMFASGRLL